MGAYPGNPLPLGPWPKGANNLAREDSVPRGSFRDGVNVETYPNGKLRSRAGYTKAFDGASDSLWGNGPYGFYRQGTDLYLISNGARTLALSSVSPLDPMVYCDTGRYTYLTDQVHAYRFDPVSRTLRPWGVAAPAGQPTLTATAAGGLDAGAYQVAVTFSTADGEESGTGLAAMVDVPAGGGVLLSAIQQPTQSHVTTINVYMTLANGKKLRYWRSAGVGTTTLQLNKQRSGKILDTQFFEAFPACSDAAAANGRLYGLIGNLLVNSRPLQYGQMNPAEDYYEFPGDCRMVATAGPISGGTGLFVATDDATYFLGGTSPKDYVQRITHEAGAVPGSRQYIPGAFFERDNMPSYPLPTWLDTKGFVCVGLPDGTVMQPTLTRYAMNVAERAASMFRENRGIRQYVLSMEGPTQAARIGFTDTMEATVVRNGIS